MDKSVNHARNRDVSRLSRCPYTLLHGQMVASSTTEVTFHATFPFSARHGKSQGKTLEGDAS